MSSRPFWYLYWSARNVVVVEVIGWVIVLLLNLSVPTWAVWYLRRKMLWSPEIVWEFLFVAVARQRNYLVWVVAVLLGLFLGWFILIGVVARAWLRRVNLAKRREFMRKADPHMREAFPKLDGGFSKLSDDDSI